MRVRSSRPAAVWTTVGSRRPELRPRTPRCASETGKVGPIQASVAVLFMPRKWGRANRRASLRFAGKLCFGLCCYSGWPTLQTGPGRRDFTKPTRPGRIWTEGRRQLLTPQFTRGSKERSLSFQCAIVMICVFNSSTFFQAHSLLHSSIVFLTVGFLFPVLAAHTAPLTRTCCQSSPSFSLCKCVCPVFVSSTFGPISSPQISQFEAWFKCGK